MVDHPQSASSDSSGGSNARDENQDDDAGAPGSSASSDAGQGASSQGDPAGSPEDTDPFGGREGGPFEQRMSSEGESFQGPDGGAGGPGSSGPGSASQDPFEEFASEFEDSGFEESGFGGGGGDFDQPGPGSDAGFAYEMAKMWVRDNQKVAMVGAFAAGVFLGALLRD